MRSHTLIYTITNIVIRSNRCWSHKNFAKGVEQLGAHEAHDQSFTGLTSHNIPLHSFLLMIRMMGTEEGEFDPRLRLFDRDRSNDQIRSKTVQEMRLLAGQSPLLASGPR